ncbi:aminodeoxychorismate synthase component I [Corynebacterium sanguinis]|uniref:aminodeoxychorismate synthase component I n=1 Tax=Corynebacterium sanguinis TaxID=2594913 RepID=UPI0021AF6B93|nr:aminodeoxychorismate synthase component I [Corynebacterium sanguinis]MCT1663105.1 aminodeoxychorismate synthase component I [Corynebacterium sanguinis]
MKGACPHLILLIDNRDSYTFNLAHLIAKVSGSEPVVVRADDVTVLDLPRRIKAGEFSHIVISPGPGTPSCEADFAGSRAVIEAAGGIPVLGVCLGHQGLAHLAGAEVGRTDPRHGYTSTITHSGEGIFAGLPQGFTAVRYHSLHIDNVPDGVVVHARSEDGVVQGLEVTGQPHWGVQFHPESVLTEYGAELLRNFLALGAWRVHHECVGEAIDTEATARALMGSSGDAFWLDSATGDGFSIIGSTAGSLSKTLSYRLTDPGPDVLSLLADELSAGVAANTLPDLPFRGGWVGFIGYECAALTLPGLSPSHARAHPDAYFIRPQSFIVYDHIRERAHLMVCARGDEKTAEVEHLMAALRNAVTTRSAHRGRASISEGSWRLAGGEYEARFGEVKRALERGDSYEVCLTDTYEARVEGQGIDLYSRLRTTNPAPFGAYLRLSDIEVFSSSPERFLRVRGDRVETKPIKGTLPRERRAQELQEDAKTRAENLMIVDLLRNDLARVCVPGTVDVAQLMTVETYATVHQLVSTITGRLRPDRGLIDLVRATFPPGSMTGAPKERTCALIDALEPGPRGVYSGAIGYFGFDGNAELSVVIRTAVKQGERLTVGAGGAIVWDSRADAECAELQLKANAVIAGLT